MKNSLIQSHKDAKSDYNVKCTQLMPFVYYNIQLLKRQCKISFCILSLIIILHLNMPIFIF